ncbi:MAG: hypothetical protein HY319_17330 [Armatimonadetes bacterium]|nr:hypothetical protein [Armatimonadota bacterium]
MREPLHRDMDHARKLLRRRRGATDSLLGERRALSIAGKDERSFLRAMQEAFAHHFLSCSLYREHCRRRGFVPGSLRRSEDLPRIPYLFATVFQRHRLLSVPAEKIRLTLTSGGNGCEQSAIHLDGRSLRRIRTLVKHVYGDLGLTSPRRTNYLCFTCDPAAATDSGMAFSEQVLTSMTRVHQVFYAIRRSEDAWHLDTDGCLEHLERYERSGRPLRVLGFPAEAWEALALCVRRRGGSFRFGPFSYVIIGGGRKDPAGREIPREEFRRTTAEWLGIPPDNVRDLYSLAEHGVPYCECEFGRMHVPRASRVYVREPESLELLPWGEPGVLQLLTPCLWSFPSISLLSTDVGHLDPECPCGRRSPVLVLQGRGGASRRREVRDALRKIS